MNLTDEQTAVARYAVAEVIRRRRLTGQPLPPQLTALACALSSRGPEPDVAQSDSEPERIGSAQAAKLIGCTRRHISRIATDLDGHQVAGRWTFNMAAVIEYAQARKEPSDE